MSISFAGKGNYSLFSTGNIISVDKIRHNVGIGNNPDIYARLKITSIGSGDNQPNQKTWISGLFGSSNVNFNSVALGTNNSNAIVASLDYNYNFANLFLNNDSVSKGGSVIIMGGDLISSNNIAIGCNLYLQGYNISNIFISSNDLLQQKYINMNILNNITSNYISSNTLIQQQFINSNSIALLTSNYISSNALIQQQFINSNSIALLTSNYISSNALIQQQFINSNSIALLTSNYISSNSLIHQEFINSNSVALLINNYISSNIISLIAGNYISSNTFKQSDFINSNSIRNIVNNSISKADFLPLLANSILGLNKESYFLGATTLQNSLYSDVINYLTTNQTVRDSFASAFLNISIALIQSQSSFSANDIYAKTLNIYIPSSITYDSNGVVNTTSTSQNIYDIFVNKADHPGTLSANNIILNNNIYEFSSNLISSNGLIDQNFINSNSIISIIGNYISSNILNDQNFINSNSIGFIINNYISSNTLIDQQFINSNSIALLTSNYISSNAFGNVISSYISSNVHILDRNNYISSNALVQQQFINSNSVALLTSNYISSNVFDNVISSYINSNTINNVLTNIINYNQFKYISNDDFIVYIQSGFSSDNNNKLTTRMYISDNYISSNALIDQQFINSNSVALLTSNYISSNSLIDQQFINSNSVGFITNNYISSNAFGNVISSYISSNVHILDRNNYISSNALIQQQFINSNSVALLTSNYISSNSLIQQQFINSNSVALIANNYVSSNAFTTLFTSYINTTLNSTYPITNNSVLYTIDNNNAYYSFTSGNNLITFTKNTTCDILVVGGGGNAYSNIYAGGGGGGEVIYINNYNFNAGTYNLIVGKSAAPSIVANSINPNNYLLCANPGSDGGLAIKISTNTTNYFIGGNYTSNALIRFNYDDTTTKTIAPGVYNFNFNTTPGLINITDTNSRTYITESTSYSKAIDSNNNIITPVAWYKFNGNANDSSGNNLNLTAIGSPTYPSSDYVKGVSSILLSNASQTSPSKYLTFPSGINSLINTTNGFTISFWFKYVSVSSDTSAPLIYLYKDTNNYLSIQRSGNTTNILFNINNNSATSVNITSSSINCYNGNWHFICWSISSTGNWTIIIDNTTLLNNIFKSTIAFSSSPTNNYIGITSTSSGTSFNGYLSDLRIYNYALNTTQMSDLYNGVIEIFSRPSIDGYYNSIISSNINSFYMQNTGKYIINGCIAGDLSLGNYNINFNSTPGLINITNAYNGSTINSDRLSYSYLPIQPIAWYQFNNTNITLDQQGNYNLTSVNASSTNTALVKGSYSCQISSTGSGLTNSSFYNFNNTSFTISFWSYFITFSTTTIRTIIKIGTGTNSISIGYINPNYFQFNLGNDVLTTSPQAYNDINTWIFWTCVYNISTKNRIIYRNGNIVASDISTNGINNIVNSLIIGNSININLSDLRFFNVDLNQSQVYQLYTGIVQINYGINYNIGSGGGAPGGALIYNNLIIGGQSGTSNLYLLNDFSYPGNNSTTTTGGSGGGGSGYISYIRGTDNPLTVSAGGSGSYANFIPIYKSSNIGYGADGNSSNLSGSGIIIIKFPYNYINSNILNFNNNSNMSLPYQGSIGGLGDKIILASTTTFNNKPDFPFSIGYASSNLWTSTPSWGTNSFYVGGSNVMSISSNLVSINGELMIQNINISNIINNYVGQATNLSIVSSFTSNYVSSNVLTDVVSSYVNSNINGMVISSYVSSNVENLIIGNYVSCNTLFQQKFINSNSLANIVGNYVNSNVNTMVLSSYVSSNVETLIVGNYISSNALINYNTNLINKIWNATSTTAINYGGNVSIGTTTASTSLAVNGIISIANTTTGNPTYGVNGAAGTKIILAPGTATADGTGHPYAFGYNTSVLWNCVPTGASHIWYIGGTNCMQLSTSGGLNTNNGIINSGTGTITGGAITGTSLATSGNGTISSGTGTITGGAITGTSLATSGNGSITGGAITGTTITSTTGGGDPTYGITPSVGTKIILTPGTATTNGSGHPYAFGYNASVLWRCVPTGASHIWYIGGTNCMQLSTSGGLNTNNGTITCGSLNTNGGNITCGIGTITCGQVGIGKTNPGSLLDVNGTFNVSGVASYQLGSSSAPAINFGTSGIGIYGVSSIGVGIAGNLTTGQVISIVGPAGVAPYLTITANGQTAGQMSLGNAISAGNFSTWSAVYDTVLRSATNQALILQSGAAGGAIYINSTNNVGIGTSTLTAGALLTVNGIICNPSTTGVSEPSIGTIGSGTSTDGTKIVLYPGTASTYPYAIGIRGGALWYSTPPNTYHNWYVGGTSYMTLTTAALSVSGSITCTTLTVGGSAITATPALFSLSSSTIPIPNNSTSTAVGNAVNINLTTIGAAASSKSSGILLYDGNTVNTSANWLIAATYNSITDTSTNLYNKAILSFAWSTTNTYNSALTGPTNPPPQMYITGGGQLYVHDDIISFNNASDIKLKENIKNLDSSLILLSKLRTVEFTWKNIEEVIERKRNTVDYGFIAQEVEKILPHLTFDSKDYKTIKYEKIVPFLVKGIQELYEDNKIIKDRITKLEEIISINLKKR